MTLIVGSIIDATIRKDPVRSGSVGFVFDIVFSLFGSIRFRTVNFPGKDIPPIA